MTVKPAAGVAFPGHVPALIVGAGAAGLCAALAAYEAGAEVLVLERDAVPSGSTALSAGLIPAAGTRFQAAKNIHDTPEMFAEDIQHKNKHTADRTIAELVAEHAAPAVEWLADLGLPFEVVDDFNYPGHSALRMHGLPTRSGAELIDRLRAAVEARDIPILCHTVVTALYADADGRLRGVETQRGGAAENVGCGALILACNGYGGDRELVKRHIPDMADALYFGHPGNRGDALRWGDALGAELRDLSGYQGHGSVATPHNILISWAVVMEGGFQVNRDGVRFSDETQGYSEQAAVVLRQPAGIAFDIFDTRIAAVARQFLDFREAEAVGAIVQADSVEALAQAIRVPEIALTATMAEVDAQRISQQPDRFGRRFGAAPLTPPYCAVKVTGALFHTQGGLAVDTSARVKRRDGTVLPNLFAAGGAACGVSGGTAAGYLSGNGLLTAVTLGRIAGLTAGQV